MIVYKIEDYIKDDAELQKAVIQDLLKEINCLSNEINRLKQCLEDVMDLNNMHNSIIQRIQSKIEEGIL